MRRWPAVGVLVLVLVSAGCSGAPAQPRTVDRSTPVSTLRAYLDALVQGDAATAASLLTPQALAADLDASWREDAPPISDVTIGTPRPAHGSPPVLPATTLPADGGYAAVVDVPVTFELHDRSGQDGFAGGHTSWGFTVVRDGPTDPWMVSGNGV